MNYELKLEPVSEKIYINVQYIVFSSSVIPLLSTFMLTYIVTPKHSTDTHHFFDVIEYFVLLQ